MTMTANLSQPDAPVRDDPETALETARHQLERAATELDLNPNIIERLKYPARVQRVSLPLERDDGSVEIFTGYRAQHDSVRGPYKGGLRYHPEVTEDECIGRDVDDLENGGDGPSTWWRKRWCRC